MKKLTHVLKECIEFVSELLLFVLLLFFSFSSPGSFAFLVSLGASFLLFIISASYSPVIARWFFVGWSMGYLVWFTSKFWLKEAEERFKWFKTK